MHSMYGVSKAEECVSIHGLPPLIATRRDGHSHPSCSENTGWWKPKLSISFKLAGKSFHGCVTSHTGYTTRERGRPLHPPISGLWHFKCDREYKLDGNLFEPIQSVDDETCRLFPELPIPVNKEILDSLSESDFGIELPGRWSLFTFSSAE